MKILTKKKQKKILQEITLLMIASIHYVDPNAMPIFADHLGNVALLVGDIDSLDECVCKAIELS